MIALGIILIGGGLFGNYYCGTTGSFGLSIVPDAMAWAGVAILVSKAAGQ